MRKTTLLLLSLWIGATLCSGQQILTLEQCHELAFRDNKQSQIDKENVEAASDMRKAALANFFPKFNANAAYMYNDTKAHILPQVMNLSNGGTLSDQGFSNWQPATFIGEAANAAIGDVYSEIYKQMTLDFTHVVVGQVGVVQPIYVGGKVAETYKLSKAAENLAKIKAVKNKGELIVSVDEAYWRVISVQHKRTLADQYAKLLRQLLANVEAAEEAGLVTKADVLKVRVKLNEAESSLSKAENGLVLSKMALCQMIGLDLTADIQLDDSGLEEVLLTNDKLNIDDVLNRRNEIQMLTEAKRMAQSGVRLVGSTLQPNLVASANYIITNPNVKDGFQNKFNGFFSAGVVLNVPIAHPNDILMLKAAKHKAKTVDLQMDEAREKIELQATQSMQKVIEANNNLIRAKANISHAEENMRFAQEAFDAGLCTATDLMMAQTAWQAACSEKIDAAIELRIAEVTFKKNTGKLQ